MAALYQDGGLEAARRAFLALWADLFAEVAFIATHFATTHGPAIAAELGMDPNSYEMDLTGIKAGFGVDPTTTTTLTYAELNARANQLARHDDRVGKRIVMQKILSLRRAASATR